MIGPVLQLPVIGLSVAEFVVLLIASFAGGLFGAALGALPAFIFTGFMVIAGEAINILTAQLGEVAGIATGDVAPNVTALVAFGPVFGPHISFAGGAAATAYAAKNTDMDTGFDYHEGKNILYAFGTEPDVLLVGGAFGILGMLIRQISGGLALPWDPIAMGVTLSAVAHRLVFGYPLVGKIRGDGLFDMSPFARGDMRQAGDVAADGGVEESRLAVEPWLPHQYKWSGVALLGIGVGVLGSYIALVTESFFLGFGISAASLLFLNCGVEKIPVTHHITLPSSTAALIFGAGGDALLALLVGTVFGLYGALAGEAHQRIFYAHSDTHWDPPAAAIVLTTFTIAVLAILGVFPDSGWVPVPV
ncbi:hypothetical protein NDI56_00970 [Haloarcula sp. S1CR25-12]|uniref:DUF7973 domain-containing protein n=1 Tax=Haloarcula saliterrae TaxID=2950534 RepID=A0ABU2F6W4_9EURY|nr:hypothetical protein [Haloarcula sp. S1CR25-12]MDS0257974.1 hypothetical protein [Haloarcula sp. S1CR25-12]